MKTAFIKTITFISLSMLITSGYPQSETEKNQEEFDKKFRFGIKVNPQFSWAKSSEKSVTGGGASMAFGFGLMTEIRLSKIIGILTGIGADFEKYKLNYRVDNDFTSVLVIDKEDNYVEFKDGMLMSDYLKEGYSQFVLKSRTIRTTFVTIPLQFKMNTQEYNGIRYFGIFGGDIGIRTKMVSNDEYASGSKAVVVNNNYTLTPLSSGSELSRSNVKVAKDASLIPIRLGLNVGAGLEYRLASSTALYFSLNYFLGFNNLLRGESKYIYKGQDTQNNGPNGYDFAPLKQNVTPNAFKINVGIFF
ncbi:MAG: PorT family protein [Bacteroidia bacterium]|nr:PorT family protein [Bacteroidia bacterium]